MEVTNKYSPITGINNTMETPPTAAFLAQSRVPQILFGSIFPAGIATIFVLGRFYSRIILLRHWGSDDTFVLISWLTGAIALTVINCDLTRFGSGRHAAASSFLDLGPTVALGFAARLLYQFNIMATKLRICAFYMRVFQDRRSKMFVWATAGYILAFSIPLIIATILQCSPPQGAWKPVPSKCHDGRPPFEASAILGIIADCLLLAFVIPRILALHLPRRQKVSLFAVCCMSILVIIAAIIRLVRVLKVVDSTDTPWDSYDISIWTSVEVNVGLFCASAPATKPLLKKIVPGMGFSTTDSSPGIKTSSRYREYAKDTMVSRRRQTQAGGDFEMMSSTDLDLEFGSIKGQGTRKKNDALWVSDSDKDISLKDGEDGDRVELQPPSRKAQRIALSTCHQR
ncbi:uncharacterized protein LY89DRAFT_742070 [Mollisia scopiformis]|uniref:Rhodopsin domain-containing protein n=1 Tax=Mollisia scopiformis TaxID=149040 RepID=A0A132B747_MOLSC|nr:uncharacterized protein LY89DRAFT_742070 [Mollisia scopiformis]KUJ08230.1 hypothetical protein LY89DRAFT_742070 [Mollisia scopiformis]